MPIELPPEVTEIEVDDGTVGRLDRATLRLGCLWQQNAQYPVLEGRRDVVAADGPRQREGAKRYAQSWGNREIGAKKAAQTARFAASRQKHRCRFPKRAHAATIVPIVGQPVKDRSKRGERLPS